jgi:dihydroneopterin aldolase
VKNKPAADAIFIRNLKVPAQVGILPWELTSTQMVVLNMTFGADIKAAAATDHVQDTIDYAAVATAITAYLATHRFNLIETLAEKSAEFLLERFQLSWLRLRATKPQAVPEAQGGVGVLIERHRKI